MEVNDFYVLTPGDCIHLSKKEKTWLALYKQALLDPAFREDEVEYIRSIIEECGELVSIRGKQILRNVLAASIPGLPVESIQAFEASAMVGKLDREIAQWDLECDELGNDDEPTEEEKLEFFADVYAEHIFTEAELEMEKTRRLLKDSNPSIFDIELIPAELREPGSTVVCGREFVIKVYGDPDDGGVILTDECLETMLGMLKDFKPAD